MANAPSGGSTTTSASLDVSALPESPFGRLVVSRGARDAASVVAAAEADPDVLPRALAAGQGLLVMHGLDAIGGDPDLLLRLSRLFGPEVEDYRQTLTVRTSIHDDVPEIFIVSNLPPVDRQPPARPEPPLTADGRLPTRFPHRRGWHTDQSYRRPPPDISLFYCVTPAPRDQAQTLYANGIAAYAALPDALKRRIENLEGLHVKPGTGRSEHAVRAGEIPQPLKPHERSRPQPVVRTHPVTGEKALYLCEAGQMDWIEGPFVGLEPGPDGAGAKLLYELMSHYTRPEFVYAHEWTAGDLVIYDNRCTIHAATWFDAKVHGRVMWRTTVHGNPGALYAGERKSWLPAA